MKVLFIGKEKKKGHLSILVERQLNALQAQNNTWTIHELPCKGNGLRGYLSIYKELKSTLRTNNYDILHAHYSLIGVLALLARGKEKVIVSFMGSDVYFNSLIFKLARWYVLKKADHIIVKSNMLLEKLGTHSEKISVIPNGVDLSLFKPMDKIEFQHKLGWPDEKLHILFPAGINRYEKNFELAEKVITDLKAKYSIELHLLENINPLDVPKYLNATDIVLLTSRWEGSSNVTKESMACNTVVVSTEVGHIEELFKDTNGYYIAKHQRESITQKVEQAISFINTNQPVNGRKRLKALELDEISSVIKISEQYKYVRKQKDTR